MKNTERSIDKEYDNSYAAGFAAAKFDAENECRRISNLAAQQDDTRGYAWAIACQMAIEKITLEGRVPK